MAASTSSPSVISKDDVATWKAEFNNEVLKSKNDSSNNPLFSVERYDETVALITDAKLKRFGDRSEQEISLLKTYDVINFGGVPKLVRKMSLSVNGVIKYYVPFNELFDGIHEAHVSIGHRGIHNTVKEIKKKYYNITEKQAKMLYNSRCHYSAACGNK